MVSIQTDVNLFYWTSVIETVFMKYFMGNVLTIRLGFVNFHIF